MIERFSEYQIMWIFVFFDLPTETKKERKRYAEFGWFRAYKQMRKGIRYKNREL